MTAKQPFFERYTVTPPEPTLSEADVKRIADELERRDLVKRQPYLNLQQQLDAYQRNLEAMRPKPPVLYSNPWLQQPPQYWSGYQPYQYGQYGMCDSGQLSNTGGVNGCFGRG